MDKKQTRAPGITSQSPTALIIPAKLNIVLFFLSALICISCLWACSQPVGLIAKVISAIVFSFVANTMFSLLHEAVHSNFNENKKVNYLFGILASAFFPTGFTLQKTFHLSHHQFNRSEKKQFDYIHEGDNKFFKYAQWYSILTGIYWIVALLGALLVFIIPEVFGTRFFKGKLADQTGATSMFYRLKENNYTRIRLELLYSVLFQLSLFYLAGITIEGWLLCYCFFAVNWSGLQYADHAFSELDSKEGAWNLKVSGITQYLFLNYHSHKVHHLNMQIPWIHLNKYIAKDEVRPAFWSVYLSMWKGPRPFPKERRELKTGA